MPSPEGKPLPLLTFDHISPIPINVGAVQTNAEQGLASEVFVVSPYEASDRYLHARFSPNGFQGTLKGIVEQASIIHSYQPSESKAASFFKVGGLDVYDMVVQLRLEHMDEGNRSVYGTVLTARRIVKVSEHASIAQRERRQLEGMEFLFKDLDQEVQRVVLKDMRLALAGN